MAFSYTFHISAKGHSVSNKAKANQVGRHNLREYKSDEYDKSKIDVMVGEGSMLDCIQRVYHQEFDDALEKYNHGKRADRQIADYLDHVDKSRSDVAVEIIVQIGDRDFWADVRESDKRKMSEVFQDQLNELERIVPNFKVASAVAHYDEASPHLHIVGVPVATGYQKGMEKQCAKTKVFTQETLTVIQDAMHKNAEKNVQNHPEIFDGMELKEKEVGRNKDIPKQALDEYYALQDAVEETRYQLGVTDCSLIDTIEHKEMIEHEVAELEEQKRTLEKAVEDGFEVLKGIKEEVNVLEAKMNVLEAKEDVLEADEQGLVRKFLALPHIKEMFEDFKKKWEKEKERIAERQATWQQKKERVFGTMDYYENRIAERKQQGSGLFGERKPQGRGSGLFGEQKNRTAKTDKGHEDRV